MISFEPHFDRATLDRGKTYQRAGHVVSVVADNDGGLEARVHNGKGTTYRQSIQIKPATARKPDGEVLGLCSCPVSFNCKHVAAALLDYKAQARAPGRSLPALVPAAVQHWLRQVQDSPDSKPQDAESAPHERPDDYPETIKDRLLYVTDFTQGELRIDICKGRMNVQGTGLNKTIRRYDVIYQLRGAKALPGFFRPLDLDLLSRLARSRRLTGQPSYASYDLPDVLLAADQLDASLLAEICNTGCAMVATQRLIALLVAWSDVVHPLFLGWISLGDDGCESSLGLSPPDGICIAGARRVGGSPVSGLTHPGRQSANCHK